MIQIFYTQRNIFTIVHLSWAKKLDSRIIRSCLVFAGFVQFPKVELFVAFLSKMTCLCDKLLSVMRNPVYSPHFYDFH